MNLLLDQNISFRVVTLLTNTFTKVDQVRALGLENASDIEIWSYALENNYTIVTSDSDFIDLATLKGAPPKIIWLRFGNSSNLKIANKLIHNAEAILNFIDTAQLDIAFLEIA